MSVNKRLRTADALGKMHEADKLAIQSTSKLASYVAEPKVQLGVDIPKSLRNKLQLASMLRKQAGKQPCTQAEIVACALADWLAREGDSLDISSY